MKKYLGSLLTLMMVATMSFVFTSCGDDDDDNTPDFVGEWQECESTGDYNFRDDATEEEVKHFRLRKDGTGEYWSVTKGKKKYENTFDYAISFSGITGTMTLVCRSSSNESEVGRTETGKITYVDGILHAGEIFYKKK